MLALSAVAGLFLVVTGRAVPVVEGEDSPASTDPLELLEGDLAPVIYGPGFREVPTAPPDTIVRSMDLVDSITLHQANLHITRTLRDHDFQHLTTYRFPERGLSFICRTPEGYPLRLELNNNRL